MTAEAGAGRGGKLDTLPAVGPLGELGLSRWGDGSPPPTLALSTPPSLGCVSPLGLRKPGFGLEELHGAPGLSELKADVRSLWPGLWLDPRGAPGPFLPHMASEHAASPAASTAPRVQTPGGRAHPQGLAQETQCVTRPDQWPQCPRMQWEAGDKRHCWDTSHGDSHLEPRGRSVCEASGQLCSHPQVRSSPPLLRAGTRRCLLPGPQRPLHSQRWLWPQSSF